MFSNVKTKTNSSFDVKVTQRSNHSFLLSIWWITFSRHLYDNGIKRMHKCVNIWKTSEVANLIFPWIFSGKLKFFHVSIVNIMEWFNDRTDWHYDKSLLSEASTLIKPIASPRSSRREVFYKRGVLRNFAKLTGKHLCQSFLLNKVAGSPATLSKKRL